MSSHADAATAAGAGGGMAGRMIPQESDAPIGESCHLGATGHRADIRLLQIFPDETVLRLGLPQPAALRSQQEQQGAVAALDDRPFNRPGVIVPADSVIQQLAALP